MFNNGFPEEWSTLRKLAWLYRTVINAVSAVLKTVTGNPIHILDALAKPAQSLSVKLEPVQDLHGYDNPWPAGGGVNLLPPYSSPSATDKGVTLTNNNGEYTLNGATGSNVAIFDIRVILPAGQYTVALNNPAANSKVQIYGIDKNVAVPLQVFCSTANATVTATFSDEVKTFRIRVLQNATLNNFKLSPVFSAGATAATKFYPYENLCPISGHTDADVIVSPTLDPSDGTTYPIPLGTTVYGGTLDVTTGVLTVDRVAYVFDGTYLGSMSTSPSYPHLYTVGLLPYIGVQQPFSQNYCSHYKPLAGNFNEDCFYLQTPISNRLVSFNDMRFTTAEEFRNYFIEQYAAGTPVTVCYKLATPQTIQLTPQQVELLQGENNIFSDGEMTLVYLADGNASDVEALNILLGGHYVNNHEADEPSDREALDIVLGGKK
jgi:hypothetical protein